MSEAVDADLTELNRLSRSLAARLIDAEDRIRRARCALIATGYFTESQVGDDIAPRIVEYMSATGRDWRTTTSGRPLGRAPDRIDRHSCGCITGWDDVYEQCVLRRCEQHTVRQQCDFSEALA